MPSQDGSVSWCAVGYVLFCPQSHCMGVSYWKGKENACTKIWVHSQAAFIKRFLFGPCDSKARGQEPLLFSILLGLSLPAVWAIVLVKCYILAVVSRRVSCLDVMLLHFGPRLVVSLLPILWGEIQSRCIPVKPARA